MKKSFRGFARSFLFRKTIFSFSLIPLFHQILKARKTSYCIEKSEFPVNLSKETFVNELWGNSKDFFIIVVYDDTDPEIAREAAKFAKNLMANLKSEINVYLLGRRTLNDVKMLVNRANEKEIFLRSDAKRPIECFLKSPYSDESAYLKASAKKIGSLTKWIQKYQNLITKVDSVESLSSELFSGKMAFDLPVLISTFSENKGEKEKLIFNALDKKILPRDSRILHIEKNLAKEIGLDENEDFWIMRNDLSSFMKIEKSSTFHLNIKDKSFLLEKFSESLRIAEYCERNNINSRGDLQFQNFVIPDIIYLRNGKFKNLSPLFRKMTMEKKKMVLCLYLEKSDEFYEKRLETYKRLYEKYKDQFTFLICSGNLEELFPHISPNSPKFSLFQMFQHIENPAQRQDYYERVSVPYQKYYLRDEENLYEGEKELGRQIDNILEGKEKPDYYSTTQDLVKKIDSRIMAQYFQKGPKTNTLVMTHSENSNSRNLLSVSAGLAISQDEFSIEKIEGNSESPYFSLIHSTPSLYLFLAQCRHPASLYFKEQMSKGELERRTKEFILLSLPYLQSKCLSI